MVQRIRPESRKDQDSKQLIEQQLCKSEKVEQELREQERRERANQLGIPGLVMPLQ